MLSRHYALLTAFAACGTACTVLIKVACRWHAMQDSLSRQCKRPYRDETLHNTVPPKAANSRKNENMESEQVKRSAVTESPYPCVPIGTRQGAVFTNGIIASFVRRLWLLRCC